MGTEGVYREGCSNQPSRAAKHFSNGNRLLLAIGYASVGGGSGGTQSAPYRSRLSSPHPRCSLRRCCGAADQPRYGRRCARQDDASSKRSWRSFASSKDWMSAAEIFASSKDWMSAAEIFGKRTLGSH